MKAGIHPEYVAATMTCGCGSVVKTRSTKANITVEVCASCHPFFTGKQKFVDTAGRVEKFQKKFSWDDEKAKTVKKAPAAKVVATEAPKKKVKRPAVVFLASQPLKKPMRGGKGGYPDEAVAAPAKPAVKGGNPAAEAPKPAAAAEVKPAEASAPAPEVKPEPEKKA
ncbi:MAG: 50S ribosomal protein L31 [Planctomycetota bacterium]